MKKLVSLILSFSTVFSMMTPAASAYQDITSGKIVRDETPDITEEQIVSLTAEDGTVYEVLVTVHTYFPEGTDVSSFLEQPGISTYGVFPDYPVGTMKTFEFTLDNEKLKTDLDIVADVGTVVGAIGVDKISAFLAEAIGVTLSNKFIIGLLLAHAIADGLLNLALRFQMKGFVISVDMEYTSQYINSGGYYMYGWDYRDVSWKKL